MSRNTDKSFVCEECNASYKYSSGLYTHKKNAHNYNMNVPRRTNMVCFLCQKGFYYSYEYRNHLEQMHDQPVERIIMEFKSFEEFSSWKEKMEHDTNSSYFLSGRKTTGGNEVIYFRCSRTGNFSTKSKGLKKMKVQGTSKINNHCTSSMSVYPEENNVLVKFFSTHYGHDVDLEHVRLSKIDKAYVSSKLLQGIEPKEILNDIKNTVDGTCEKIHLIGNKQIKRIEECIGLNTPVQRDSNDMVSVEMWVKENRDSNDNAVIYYKNHGDSHLFLEDEDFALGIMTQTQANLLQKIARDGVVCMDVIHETYPYDLKLISLLTIDDRGEGYPAAFFFCNREDEVALREFLIAVREKAGPVICKSFMSADDAPQYFRAWSSTMEHSPGKLLCSWHVERTWEEKLNTIVDKEKKEMVQIKLKLIQSEIDKNTFEEMKRNFVEEMLIDPDLHAFCAYFESYYAERSDQWGYSHSVSSTINGNMYLESLHRVIKCAYTRGNTIRRLDTSVHILMQLIKDKQYERLVKVDIRTKINEINERHKMAEELSLSKLFRHDGFWTVESSLDKSNQHTVRMNDVISCEDSSCILACSKCKFCFHAYTCTCSDYLVKSRMCEHIHLVGRSLNDLSIENVETLSLPSEEIDLEFTLSNEPKAEETEDQLHEKIAHELACCVQDHAELIKSGTTPEHLKLILTHVSNLQACFKIKPKEDTSNKTSMESRDTIFYYLYKL